MSCQTSSESVLLRMEGIICIFENEAVDKFLEIQQSGSEPGECQVTIELPEIGLMI